MVATLVQAVAFASVADAAGTGRPGITNPDKPIAGKALKHGKARTVQKGSRTPQKAPKATWPSPDDAVVSLAEPASKAGRPVQAKGLPLQLNTPSIKQTKKPLDGKITTRVLPQKAAKQAGVDGLLFTLQPESTKDSGTVGTTVDYADFAEAYGGGYGSRLTLVELPACALTTPDKATCRSATPVATDNDTEQQRLTASTVPLKAGTPTVLAALAGDSAKTGDYKATPLAPSATWSTDLNTGDFGWSYDIPAPEVPGEMSPKVALSYSSGTIDGRTGNTNNQSSWVGDGFDLSPGYVERRYKPCADDGQKADDGVNKPGDLCWGYDNAYITFNGKGGELVPTGTADEFRFQKDDGSRIARLKSTARGNGDNDGEYWRVTDPEGNRYYFGYNRLPGWASGKESTDSTWAAPVYGDDADEPCHAATFTESWCQQAWRWNLDYAVDAHGNAIAYYYNKEDNSYGRNLKASDDTRYTRGGYLDRIEYGLKSSSMYGTKALAKVDFASSERCIADSHTDCSSISKDAFYWYDTPWDMNCEEATDCDEGRLAPSFWTRKRLTGITTQVLKDDTYSKVDSWKLTHRWGQADVDYQLLLDSIQHTGHTATPEITLPKTSFAYTQLANRMDKTGDGYAPFIKARLSTITDEYGGQTDVNYSGEACDASSLPTPQTNTARCYPQMLGGSDTEDPEQHWFNKYVVDSVTATDRTGGAPDSVTAYEYLGGAAWHYDDDDGLTKQKHKTWSQWRGYGHVRVKTGGQGGASALTTQEDSYFLRGMDGDRKDTSGGTKSVSVTLGDGEGDPITDHESAAGFAYKTVKYSGPGGNVLEKTIERPWHHQTAKRVRTWGTVTANFTGTASSKTYTSLDDGAGTKWRTTAQSTAYDTAAGRATQVNDEGDTSTTADDQCTRTTYATNTEKNILTLPSREETVAVNCATTPDRSKDGVVVSDERTAYDGGAYDAAPTKGDETASATLKKHDGTKATYLETGTTYDSYGRPLKVTDLAADVTAAEGSTPVRAPRSDGLTNTTTYSPATGFPATATTTTPPAKALDADSAQTTVNTLDPLRGMPTAQKDTNGKTKNFTYDALGRSDKVWLANRTTGQTPSYDFDYFVEEGKPVAVRTQTLDNGGGQVASYTLYDGLLRERQTQDIGPDGGRLLADTFYDERGQVAKTFSPYYTEGAPNRDLFKPADALSVETQTRHTYDGLGRETETKQIAGNGDGGSTLATTKTIYGGDRTTVIPPVGGTATTTLTDARDHATELRQHHTRSASAAYDTTTYAYWPSGRLAKVTDPASNEWKFEYDQLGNQTKISDPDKGVTQSTYDDRNQLVTTEDSRGKVLFHAYDQLGRQTALRETNATGALRASWTYDAVTGAKGQLASSTRYVGDDEYTTKVTQYDPLYRAVRSAVTIPASEGALAGTYQSGTSYKPSGLVAGVSYSAAGSLPGGSYAYTYDEALRPASILGNGYQSDTNYSLTGKPLQYTYASTASGAKKSWLTNTYEWGTQRLATSRVDRQDVAGVDRLNTYKYDEAGNVLSISDVSRAGTDNQCFAYDYLRRLSEAWAEGDTTCAAAPAASATGGAAPYWTSYTYDKVGNRKTETEHDLTGDAAKDTKKTYTYPAAGAAQPHTLTEVTQAGPSGTSKSSYSYDATGNTATRVIGGDTQKLDWDAEGHLAKVTQPVEGKADEVTEYLYDADGNRLIARGPASTTLYLDQGELVLPKGATKAKATRYIDLGSGSQAVQSDDGGISITVADHLGTGQLSIKASDLSLSQRRTLPFGGTRGDSTGTWPGTKGFVGGTDNTADTGLTHLGAREYDPTTGRFISADPVLDTDDPQQINGYAYANNNPITFSDPTGLLCALLDQSKCSGNDKRKCGQVPMAPCKSSGGGGGGGGGSSRNGNSRGSGTGQITVKVKASIPSACFGRDNLLNAIHCSSDGEWFNHENAREVVKVLLLPDTESWRKCLTELDGKSCAWASTDLPWLRLAKVAKVGKIKKVVSAGRKGCKCFLAGTGVLMADGNSKNIEDVELGDKVIATDPKTGKTSEREVTATIITDSDKQFTDLTLSTDDGTEHLTATHEHPFWSVSQHKWIPAGKLKPGMTLRTNTGRTVEVTATHHHEDRVRTYNLTVEGQHTYYVLAGQTPILVHNSNCPLTGGFKAGVSSDEIADINRGFGGETLLSGSPANTLANASRYTSFWDKSAVVIRDIAGSHMFNNGNKRTAQATVEKLMQRNSVTSGPTSADLRSVIDRVGKGQLHDVSDISAALRGY
ncbi:polymorphic toxin-type HINT domain-containing protein [Streptomyces sp. NBC_00006]|uniref:polymorphic toxin-type HINT domain-containing protein n=1 Tax=unclassified Streptomyces TaxID=2593676 RepID=UPI00224D5365|nr:MULTISPECIES: polymorphic toxin-type HINT domain-containing protein [unclassified Streptomyces]MCX5535759.1 polymorphic toxin-type HINT domain-containing protein [Streptomyces sp. NBC_00006]